MAQKESKENSFADLVARLKEMSNTSPDKERAELMEAANKNTRRQGYFISRYCETSRNKRIYGTTKSISKSRKTCRINYKEREQYFKSNCRIRC